MEKYRTFFPRLVALLIDSFIMLPIAIFDDWFRRAEYPPLFFYVWIPLSAAVFPVYMICMHGKFGQTLGKMYMNVKVVRAETEEKISFKHAFLRELPQLLFNISSVFLGIFFLGESPESERLKIPFGVFGFVTVIWAIADVTTFFYNEKRRALHDYIAGTVVIKTNL